MPILEEHGTQQQSYDDSIEDMASMLLDDTTMNQLNTNTEPGRRISQAAATEIFNSRTNSRDGTSLPQLPRLGFHDDDTWATQTAPALTAAGDSNQMNLEFKGNHPDFPLHSMPKHSRKDSSAPTVPRKSSKRRSSRSKYQLSITEKRGTRQVANTFLNSYQYKLTL